MTTEPSELREQIKKITHRIRTRALRGAPIYLQHVSEVEDYLMALIEDYCTKARIDEVERGLKHSGSHLNLVSGKPYRVEALENRLAKLNSLQKEQK